MHQLPHLTTNLPELNNDRFPLQHVSADLVESSPGRIHITHSHKRLALHAAPLHKLNV